MLECNVDVITSRAGCSRGESQRGVVAAGERRRSVRGDHAVGAARGDTRQSRERGLAGQVSRHLIGGGSDVPVDVGGQIYRDSGAGYRDAESLTGGTRS